MAHISGIGKVVVDEKSGRTYMSGGSSNIDWHDIAEQIEIAQIKKHIDPIDVGIKHLNDKALSLKDIQTTLESLQEILAQLQGVSTDPRENIFKSKIVSSSATGVAPSKAEEIVSAVATHEATVGSYNTVVSSLATSHQIRSELIEEELGAELEFSGTIIFDDEGTLYDIVVGEEDSLSDIALKINNSPAPIKATIVSLTHEAHYLILSHLHPNRPIVFDATTTQDLVDAESLGFTEIGTYTIAHEMQEAQPLEVSIEGIPITRNSNTVDDIIPGVTLAFTKSEPTTTVKIDVQANNEAIYNHLVLFAETFNKIADFLNSHIQKVDLSIGRIINEGGELANTSIMRELERIFKNIPIAFKQGGGAEDFYRFLSDIGIHTIKTSDLNSKTIQPAIKKLNIDGLELVKALQNNFDEVKKLFNFQIVSSSTKLFLVEYSLENTITSPVGLSFDFTMSGDGTIGNVSVDDGEGTQPDTAIDKNIVSIDSGPAKGLKFYYYGPTASNVTVTYSSGIGAQIYKQVESLVGDSGHIFQELADYEERRLNKEEFRIKRLSRIEEQKKNLLRQYRTAETRMSQVQAIGDVLKQHMQSLGHNKH